MIDPAFEADHLPPKHDPLAAIMRTEVTASSNSTNVSANPSANDEEPTNHRADSINQLSKGDEEIEPLPLPVLGNNVPRASTTSSFAQGRVGLSSRMPDPMSTSYQSSLPPQSAQVQEEVHQQSDSDLHSHSDNDSATFHDQLPFQFPSSSKRSTSIATTSAVDPLFMQHAGADYYQTDQTALPPPVPNHQLFTQFQFSPRSPVPIPPPVHLIDPLEGLSSTSDSSSSERPQRRRSSSARQSAHHPAPTSSSSQRRTKQRDDEPDLTEAQLASMSKDERKRYLDRVRHRKYIKQETAEQREARLQRDRERHRLMYQLKRGGVTDGMLAMHSSMEYSPVPKKRRTKERQGREEERSSPVSKRQKKKTNRDYDDYDEPYYAPSGRRSSGRVRKSTAKYEEEEDEGDAEGEEEEEQERGEYF